MSASYPRSRADLWPTNFFVHNTDRVALSEVTSWVQRHTPSLCMFMPDRLDYANDNRANEATFRSFSRMLAQNQMVRFRSWLDNHIIVSRSDLGRLCAMELPEAAWCWYPDISKPLVERTARRGNFLELGFPRLPRDPNLPCGYVQAASGQYM